MADIHSELMGLLARVPYVRCEDVHRQYAVNWLMNNGVTVPVRCKDCCHGRQIDKAKSPEKYFKDTCVVCQCESVVGDEPMIYEPTHFCSYGERRT